MTALPGFVLGLLVVSALALAGLALGGVGPKAHGVGPRIVTRGQGWRWLGAAGAGVLAFVITSWLVGAVLGAAAVWFAPRIAGGRRQRAQRIARTEAIAAWAEMLRDTLAGAAGLEETIVATARVAPPAINDAVQTLAVRLEHEPLVRALRSFATELADPTADLVVSALGLAATNPTRNLGALLGTLAASARAQASMQLRVDAGRARTRSAVRIVTGFTVAFAVGMVVLNRGYLEPFDSSLGQLVLAGIGACFAVAFVLLDRMTRASDPPRVLVRGAVL